MRIVFLGNNWLGWKVLEWLREQKEQIVGLVLHPIHKRKFGEEIIRSAQVASSRILNSADLRDPETHNAVKAMQPDIGLSVLFDYIMLPQFLDLFPRGVINLHPSYLPYNRGQYPNVWSIVMKKPAGVTLHHIDGGIDTGDIISQVKVPIEPVDTGETLYRKLEKAALELFKDTWPLIRSDHASRVPQDKNQGTHHLSRDVDNIDHIDLGRTYTAGELIDILRARTFPPYKGAYFFHKGRRIYMQLQLFYEDQMSEVDVQEPH
jgi:methionyl-tRNA formyltransferase